jgi:hypothetical protein
VVGGRRSEQEQALALRQGEARAATKGERQDMEIRDRGTEGGRGESLWKKKGVGTSGEAKGDICVLVHEYKEVRKRWTKLDVVIMLGLFEFAH